MKRAEALQVMEQDLKDFVSSLMREEYNRALGRTLDLIDLRVIELQVRKDSRLSANHRAQLLRSIEDAADKLPNWTQSEHLRLQVKTGERPGRRLLPSIIRTARLSGNREGGPP